MNDFISLTCPSCGGQINIGASTSVLKCQYCGIEHIVRRQGDAVTLESFARCPKCGRNDRVEKVSSILKSQKQEIRTIENRVEYYRDEYGIQHSRSIKVPVTHSQMSDLARTLTPPLKPKTKPKPESLPKPEVKPEPTIQKPKSKERSKKNVLTLIGAILAGSFSCLAPILIVILFDEPDVGDFVCAGSTIIIMGIGIAILILGSKIKPDDEEIIKSWEQESEIARLEWQKENELRIQEWEERNQEILEKWQHFNARIRESWEYTMDNWNNLYFCHRDDCVFVPGKGTYAPIEEYEMYLYE